jgi:hypothetical protein
MPLKEIFTNRQHNMYAPPSVGSWFHLLGFACCLFHASFLLVFLFSPEDGGYMFF